MRRRSPALALLLSLIAIPASALTVPLTGAVAFPSSSVLKLPFPAGHRAGVLSGYSPSGGSSLHDGTNRAGFTNDYYALDLVYQDEANNGKGLPVVAPLAGTVVKSGWATSGWANYGQRVILRHDLGDGHTYYSLYAHLNAIDAAVTEGANVAAGQTLGELGQSCQGALSCSSFSAPHLHWAIHQDSSIGGSGTGGSYGGNAVVPEPLDGHEDTQRNDIIMSTNGAAEVCGDNVCTTQERNSGSCAQDCPVCEDIGPAGRVVDEPDPCFEAGGSAQYWRVVSTAGLNGKLRWTHAVSAATTDNYGIWHLTLREAGTYLVEVYTDAALAQSQQAAYRIRRAGAEATVIINQAAANGWQSLGEHTFSVGGDQYVRLNDNTGEAFSLMRQLVFDGVRLTRVTQPQDAGQPVPDAAVNDMDAGVAPPVPDASAPVPDAAVVAMDASSVGGDASVTVDAGAVAPTADGGRVMVTEDASVVEAPGEVKSCQDARLPVRAAPTVGWMFLVLAVARVRSRRG